MNPKEYTPQECLEIIKKIRRVKLFSIFKLADEMGISRPQITRLLAGKANMSLPTKWKMENYIEANKHLLVDESQELV